MNKLYQRINWQNYPSDSTPLNESNLNKMDAAVDGIDDRVVTLDVTKLPVATANTMVKDVTFNETTGVFTTTKLNGTKVTVNTALEKIATNFRYDHSTQKLILTLIDGTTQEVDLSALLTQYEFLNSSTIQFTIDSSGKVKASVVNGSITGDMLEPNYLANVTLQASKADTSAKNAKESEEKAAEYAENAKNSADSVEPVASTATGTNPTIQDSTKAPLIYGKFKGYTLQGGEPTPDNPVEINGLAKDGAIEVKTCGKNLLKSTVGITTRDGVTFTTSDDGSIAINGTTNGGGYTHCYTDLNSFFNEDGKFGWMRAGKTYRFSIDSKNSNIAIYGLYNTFTNTDIYTPLFAPAKVSADVTIPEDAYKVILRIVSLAEGGYTYNNDVVYPMIHPVEITDDTYEPYTETTATIPTDAPLYEGDYIEIYADGSGKLYKKFMNFNPTTVEIVAENVGAYIRLIKGYCKARSTALCNYLKLDVTGKTTGFNFGGNAEGNFSHCFIKVLGLTTKEEYQSWLNERSDLEVVYELAAPTETPLTTEQVAQFKKLYTFEPVTNVLCDGEVEMLYLKNTDGGRALASVRRGVEHADTATKATQDADGNVITETYATKEELENFDITIDDALSTTSTNPVQNKVVTESLNDKAKKDGSNATGTWGIDITGNAETSTKATQDENGDNIVNTYSKQSSVLSTVSECEASTTDTDIVGASALSELNDSLKTKALFDKGNNGANYFYENTYTSMIVPYSTSWDYEGIAPAWYFVIIIHFSGGNTMQYWLELTGSSIYTRRTNNSGATWTVTKLH